MSAEARTLSWEGGRRAEGLLESCLLQTMVRMVSFIQCFFGIVLKLQYSWSTAIRNTLIMTNRYKDICSILFLLTERMLAKTTRYENISVTSWASTHRRARQYYITTNYASYFSIDEYKTQL